MTRHQLYITEDEDKPNCICDANGDVVLDLCRVCGQAEADLEPECPGAQTPTPTESETNDYLK